MAQADNIERVDVAAVNAKATRSLYKARVAIHPKLAHGTFRSLKWAVMAVTLGIYYLAPWLRWDRGPNMPDQAILIDFPARRFYFFFIEIWPQEVYYLTDLLILAALALFLITSLFGRVWCGYACPQTVWTDLFIMVERIVEGDRAARLRLDKAPMTGGKLAKRAVKHAIWLLIAMATGGAWVFYFADAPTLAADLATLRAPSVAYISIGVLTFTTYCLGGLMREQVCTYMCPWPRIQGALQDEESFVVSYKDDRGEPRGRYKRGESWEDRGDCIDCNNCVAVCPMGIDIRDGQQLECIHCALCIDACDDVMTRIQRPTGLIGYDTILNHERRRLGEPARVRLVRPRTLLYVALIAAVGIVMLASLVTRPVLEVNVQADRNPLFVRLSDGSIRNGFTVKILNKLHEERAFALTLEQIDGARLEVLGNQPGDLRVPSDKLGAFRVFVSVPADRAPNGAGRFRFRVTDTSSGTDAVNDTIFRGPER